MVELQVSLDFACCHCDGTVGVTLKCAAQGLTTSSRAVATVRVPCPSCGHVNQLYFEPNGTVRGVEPARPMRTPDPSVN